MKNILTICLISLFLFSQSIAQPTISPDPKPFIEVTGYAKKKVVPDEIYISITIKERESGRDEVTLEEQEKQMKAGLTKLNIPLNLLTVSDAQADYIRVKWTKKDVVARTEYELKLSTAQQVSDVFEMLDEMKINNAYISRVSHSKIQEFKQEVEVQAIKAAKKKADYLLEAIDQKTGTAMVINERSGATQLRNTNSTIRGSRGSVSNYLIEDYDKVSIGGIISFKKINLETTIYAKFEIQQNQ